MQFKTTNRKFPPISIRFRPLFNPCNYSMQHPNHPINIMEGTGTTEETIVLEATEDIVGNIEETGEEFMEAVDPVALITTDGHMVCVTTKA